MTSPATATCVCGAVRWSVAAPYRFFQYCHCSRCRKRSGSTFAANICVQDGQLQFLAGEDRVQRFELPGAKAWCNAFCSVCGSAAPWRTRNGRFWIVPAGGLDDLPATPPTANAHFASRAAWYVPAPELPTFDAEPDR